MENVDTLKTQAEIGKLIAEAGKLLAETGKLHAESAKMARERAWYPLVLVATTAAATAGLIKLFIH